MSERKVLTKYFPPDFDYRQIEKRTRGPKQVGPKVQTVRLMAPFSMRCLTCGEFIYKGRKFNARKATPEERYLNIQIYHFFIRCTRCSAEICFKTDPANGDYTCVHGAKRNVEPWRRGIKEETEEQRLDRLEKEEEERNAMVELEAKTVDAKREMAVADALDEIRTRNARLERADRDGVELALPALPEDDMAARQEREDADAARAAFAGRQLDLLQEEILDDGVDEEMPPPPVPTFKKAAPVKKKLGPAVLGIKKKESPPIPQVENKKPMASLVAYGSDSDSE